MHVPPHKDSRNGTNDGRSRIAYKIAELGDYIHACCLVARKPIGVCDIYMGREIFFFLFLFPFRPRDNFFQGELGAAGALPALVVRAYVGKEVGLEQPLIKESSAVFGSQDFPAR